MRVNDAAEVHRQRVRPAAVLLDENDLVAHVQQGFGQVIPDLSASGDYGEHLLAISVGRACRPQGFANFQCAHRGRAYRGQSRRRVGLAPHRIAASCDDFFDAEYLLGDLGGHQVAVVAVGGWL